jgi:hypothetical protein
LLFVPETRKPQVLRLFSCLQAYRMFRPSASERAICQADWPVLAVSCPMQSIPGLDPELPVASGSLRVAHYRCPPVSSLSAMIPLPFQEASPAHARILEHYGSCVPCSRSTASPPGVSKSELIELRSTGSFCPQRPVRA